MRVFLYDILYLYIELILVSKEYKTKKICRGFLLLYLDIFSMP